MTWREPTDEEEQTAPRVNGFTFWEALAVAVGLLDSGVTGMGGSTGPLADYLASDAPLTPAMKEALAELLRGLQDRWPRGRKEASRGKHRAFEVERALALRVVDKQQQWCEQRGHRHVPAVETKRMIEDDPSWQAADRSHRLRLTENVLELLRNKARL